MYMRLVQVRIKRERVADFQQLYNEEILHHLQHTEGCLYAGLLQSTVREDEGISLTFWETAAHADLYEKNGPFRDLIDRSRPFFSDTSEWNIRLSGELQLEYAPVVQEPVITTYSLTPGAAAKPPAPGHASFMYMQIVSLIVRPEQGAGFASLYEQKVLPGMRGVPGCKYVYLMQNVRETNEWLCITLWNRKEDAIAFETEDLSARLHEKLLPVLSDLYQWKTRLDRQLGRKAVTSEDMAVRGYTVVAGKSFR